MERMRKIATVGTFDGLHRGHARVISFMREIAVRRGLEPLVVTFNRHPRSVVDPANVPPFIMTPADRDRLLLAEGIPVLSVDFTPALAATTAGDWLRRLHDEEGVDVLVLGHDNKFGSDGRHLGFADYKALGEKLGVEVMEAPVEEGVSSTAIRRLVGEGRIEEANRLLGHPFVLSGVVVGGKHRGSEFGYPTANVEPAPGALIPRTGVYVAEVEMPDGRKGKGAVNIGYQPTVASGAPLRIETHILEYDGDLYGQTLRLEFLARLRDEKKFRSVEELKDQIRRDTLAASQYGEKPIHETTP